MQNDIFTKSFKQMSDLIKDIENNENKDIIAIRFSNNQKMIY